MFSSIGKDFVSLVMSSQLLNTISIKSHSCLQILISSSICCLRLSRF